MPGWVEETRVSYDTVAESYAGMMRGTPAGVHVHLRPPARVADWLVAAGFTVELEATVRPGDGGTHGVLIGRAR